MGPRWPVRTLLFLSGQQMKSRLLQGGGERDVGETKWVRAFRFGACRRHPERGRMQVRGWFLRKCHLPSRGPGGTDQRDSGRASRRVWAVGPRGGVILTQWDGNRKGQPEWGWGLSEELGERSHHCVPGVNKWTENRWRTVGPCPSGHSRGQGARPVQGRSTDNRTKNFLETGSVAYPLEGSTVGQ